MRKFVLLVATAALLALPGLTLAQTLDAFEAGTGLAAITYDPNVGGSIFVDSYLGPNTTVNSFSNMQYNLTTNGGGMDANFDVLTLVELSAMTKVGGLGNVGTLIPMPVNLATLNYTPNPTGGAEGYANFGAAYGPGTPIAQWELQPTAAGLIVLQGMIGGSITVEASTMVNASNGVNGLPILGGAPLVVNLVPEPASVLLMLGVIPFLRRRR
jgi:hypothetical protein